jgi:hypothetical protein
MVFKNKELKKIFGLRRDKVTGDWRKLHNEQQNKMYSFSIYYQEAPQIKEDEIGRTCSRHGGNEKLHTKFWLGSLKRRDHSQV